jgi:hypothetical protein
MFSWKNLVKNRKVIVTFGQPINLKIHKNCELQDMSDGANLVMSKIDKLARR